MDGIGGRWRRGWLRSGRILYSLNNQFNSMSVATLEKPGVKPKLKPLVVSAELLAEAADSAPVALRGTWGSHFQVFTELMGNGKGHNCKSAAQWFVVRGYVGAGDLDRFYLAMRMRWQKQKRKEGE